MRLEFAFTHVRSNPLTFLFELSGILVTLLLLGSVGGRYVVRDQVQTNWPVIVIGLAGAGLLIVQVATSHAAAEPGLLPVLASAAHWLAIAAWGGVAIFLAVTGRATLATREDVVAIGRRYARLSLAAAVIAGISGGVLGFVHVHNPDALATTAYGSAYKVKLGLAAALLLALALQITGLRATNKSEGDAEAGMRFGNRLLRQLRIEALLMLCLVVTSALLASRSPAGLAPFINPQSWTVATGERMFAIDVQPVSGQLGRVRFEIAPAEDRQPLPEGTIVTMSMVTVDGSAGLRDIEALPIGPTEYLAETVLATPGDWQMDLTFEPPGAAPFTVNHVVTVPGPPLQQDMHAYLSMHTVTYNAANIATFATGLLLIVTAAWVFRMHAAGRTPGWLLPLSFASASFGALLILGVMFVKTYPSSFWQNSVPLTADNVRAGDDLYREHCAECHGLTGRGNGPWAIEHHGSIPDLTSPHMDTHTDGEIYWWIRYGIPSLDMPGYEDVLSDDENWTIINFMRSLRHGVPAQE